MKFRSQSTTRAPWAVACATLWLAACSGGNGPSSTQTEDDFALLSTNLKPGSVWELNRPIELRFNSEVDIDSLSANSVAVVRSDGVTASGVFRYGLDDDGEQDRTAIVFQPNCPTLEDLSDSGLQPEFGYELQISAGLSGQVTVLDLAGRPLETGGAVPFVTTQGASLGDLFVDTRPGPPAVRVRGGTGVPLDDLAATYLEIGGDPDQREYLSLDENGRGALAAGVEAPLNLYSAVESRVVAVVFFDQPLAPGDFNLNSNTVGLEWRLQGDAGEWQPLVSEVTLVANCAETGAIARVEPQGVLPQDAELRILVRSGLSDLTGELTVSPSDRAGRFPTRSAAGEERGADEILERFVAGAGMPGSREDDASINGLPRAAWGDGLLQASFDFEGTGGIGGDFDFVLTAGQELIVNTSFAQITGGPGGTPAFTQDVFDGVLDVNDLIIGPGASLAFVGPNPATILATGDVDIAGEISVRGSNNNGVGALNTAEMPEVGSAGNAGGGTGGTGSFLTGQSTPRGGTGLGPNGAAGQGGQGGETGFGMPQEDERRGAGGGGGQLGFDVFYDHDGDPSNPDRHCQTLIGMDAESGAGGTATGLGAISMIDRPMGGAPGPRPFVDDSDQNNFFGSIVTAGGEFVLGEAGGLLGGRGGGGGGDAVRSETFPLTPFVGTGDEKGSGGGGAGGALRILAIGSIILRETGSIVADGGYGGGGENTFNSARVAGGGGGGSGGHIVLSSASFVEIQAEASMAGDGYRDDPTALNHFARPLSALGGQGGEGHRTGTAAGGGASGNGNTSWARDAVIPVTRMEVPLAEGGNVPPLSPVYQSFFPDYSDPLGPALACAGDGGPGILQIHVENPAEDLRFTHGNLSSPYGVADGADVTRACAPPPVGWNGVDEASNNLLPFFGRFSASQSGWIHLGLPSLGPGGEALPVEFLFAGIDTVTGEIDAEGGVVSDLPAILGPIPVGQGTGTARLKAGGQALEIEESALPQPYRMSVQLLVEFELRLEVPGSGTSQSYVIAAVTRDGDSQVVCLHTAGDGPSPGEFLAGGGEAQASVIPRFLAVETAGAAGSLPSGTSVRISFDATLSNSLGEPADTLSYSANHAGAFTSDIGDLATTPWSWVRYRVIFDLAEDGVLPLDQPLPGLRLLRLPFLLD